MLQERLVGLGLATLSIEQDRAIAGNIDLIELVPTFAKVKA